MAKDLKKPLYNHLKDKWVDRHKKLQKNLWEKHGEALQWALKNPKQLAVGSIGGLMMLAAPVSLALPKPTTLIVENPQQPQPSIDTSVFVVNELSKVVPSDVRPLTTDEEKTVGEILSRDFHLKVSAELEGNHLNRSYGLIGAEQHLPLYPGDSISIHFSSDVDANNYADSGMTPGLGAWGYFASSKEALTQKDIEREKYYIAVQSFLIPDYNQKVTKYRDFLKYRKMLVVNPQNGKAVVADIADAGPAEWTGKHLGGSPEVMSYLERFDGAQRGPVLYFFIDDPNDTVPLGPVTL